MAMRTTGFESAGATNYNPGKQSILKNKRVSSTGDDSWLVRQQLLETNNGTTKYTRGLPGPYALVTGLTADQKEFLSEDTNHFFDYLDAVRAWKFRVGTMQMDVPG